MRSSIKSCYLIFLLLSTITVFCQIFFIPNVIATSPPFALQGIYNNRKDWSLQQALGYETVKNIKECKIETQHQFPSPHIAAVNYISNGENLNATLWLSAPFKAPITSLSYPLKQVERSYALLIHIDSAYDIGQNYQAIIQWNPITHTWSMITKESSPPFIHKSQNDKVVKQEDNYTGFFVKGENYIDLSLNLAMAGFPAQYSIVSYASDTYLTKDYHVCHLIDVTDIVHVPPPEFEVEKKLPPTSFT